MLAMILHANYLNAYMSAYMSAVTSSYGIDLEPHAGVSGLQISFEFLHFLTQHFQHTGHLIICDI